MFRVKLSCKCVRVKFLKCWRVKWILWARRLVFMMCRWATLCSRHRIINPSPTHSFLVASPTGSVQAEGGGGSSFGAFLQLSQCRSPMGQVLVKEKGRRNEAADCLHTLGNGWRAFLWFRKRFPNSKVNGRATTTLVLPQSRTQLCARAGKDRELGGSRIGIARATNDHVE